MLSILRQPRWVTRCIRERGPTPKPCALCCVHCSSTVSRTLVMKPNDLMSYPTHRNQLACPEVLVGKAQPLPVEAEGSLGSLSSKKALGADNQGGTH